ncbi:MAG TPA: DUF4267 domain-containing protein [Pseudomonadota bacterium]|nr:DUF4267 domain-containing protein [Pseudomonadota bacterium]
MSDLLRLVITGMGFVRIALGLAPFIAAGPASRALGFPAAQDSPTARLMARLFGVRDIGLGVLAFYALRHPETASFLFLFNAAMDGGDLVSMSIPLIRREGIDRAALTSAVFALIGGSSWIVVWILTR